MPDKGVAVHWSVNAPPADHAGCVALVNQIAQLHASKGSTGFTFYNWLYCNHGERIKGRGWDRQSGANGTSQANRDYWAACWIGGPGHTPTQGAFAVLSALIVEAPGANVARPHSDFYSTACPGPDLTAFARAWTGTPAPSPAPTPTQGAAEMFVYNVTDGPNANTQWLKDGPTIHGLNTNEFRAFVASGAPWADLRGVVHDDIKTKAQRLSAA